MVETAVQGTNIAFAIVCGSSWAWVYQIGTQGTPCRENRDSRNPEHARNWERLQSLDCSRSSVGSVIRTCSMGRATTPGF